MPSPAPDFLTILRVLTGHGVDFVIVGGVCGVLHGAPIATFDLDVVHSREPANIDRLLAALSALGAHARGAGPLDLLGVIAHDRGYEDLVCHSTEVTVSGMCLRLLDLETLIETKETIARDKDLAVLAILRRTLEEKRK